AYTNGVAKLHTDILKTDVLNPWYKLHPERFQNKTNGITQRRWLLLCNPELSGLLTKLLGDDKWITDLPQLKKLEKFADDDEAMRQFMAVKQEKKRQLSEYILRKENVKTDENSIFDIQIKRLHEYKRQLMNAFSIMYIYFGIKDGRIKNFKPVTFIFGAKSAPGYLRAKGIIKYINEIAGLIDADPQVRDLIKTVFVTNYNVSYAEKLVAAADVSEQISTAGTEASGTGNMKLMLNGAVTLGTYDGANIEIFEEAGEHSNYRFGKTTDELKKLAKTYDPREIIAGNAKIRRVVQTLIDGTVSDGGTGIFRELYGSLTDGASWHKPDSYFLLADLEEYAAAKLKINTDYTDKIEFARKCWKNICNAGKFSSDRTVLDYAENIWGIV
ncbi:MAG: glycogen/starch/alpha-glucan phosphorylase, partial [Oscillospiraceae bacterium]|nr:glycogen/starch/alpha-glucan phosphorylase [Oscillospiraceae bacterium]